MTFRTFFSLILIGDLLVQNFRESYPIGEYIFKPALMISLAVYFYNRIRETSASERGQWGDKQDRFILGALLFSCLGDIALIFKDGFLPGLGSFLIAHLFYIFAFLQDNQGFIFSKKDRIYWGILVLLFGMGLMGYLLPHLGEMQIPVGVYSTTILVMLLTALNRWKSVSALSFQGVLAGAILFVLSDSMIAISRFVAPFPLSGISIMVTYAVGQYLIVMGYLQKKGI
jgi:uncharacterized membrane protein YhhN